jgi:hypothetical protein
LIEVKAEKSKTAQRRFVTMQPNLREWLLPLRKHKGNVTPALGFRESFEQAREAAGIAEWPDNALRHSFASYHLSHFKNAASTALELGHHDSRITFCSLPRACETKRGRAVLEHPASKNGKDRADRGATLRPGHSMRGSQSPQRTTANAFNNQISNL